MNASTPRPDAGHELGALTDERSMTRLLRRVIDLASLDLELKELLGRVADLVVEASGADVCFVHVLDHDTDELYLAGATPPFDDLVGQIRLPLGEGIAGWVAEQGAPTVVNDKWADTRYRYIPALRGEDFSSLISLPLLRPRDRVVGVLNLHSRRADHFADGDVAVLSQAANLLAGIVDNAVLYHRLATREAELERFAALTIELQERDRQRLAGDIHDGISQRLIGAFYHLRAARTLAAPTGRTGEGVPRPIDVELSATEALLSDALDEARRAVAGLRPAVLDDLGLIAGLTSLAGTLGEIDVELDLEPGELPPHVETALYRIVQEAFQNVQKHARAGHVSVRLRPEAGRLALTVADDGVGFDPSARRSATSYGLAGLHERAALIGADVAVRSRPGAGTTVSVVLPATPSPPHTSAVVDQL